MNNKLLNMHGVFLILFEILLNQINSINEFQNYVGNNTSSYCEKISQAVGMQ